MGAVPPAGNGVFARSQGVEYLRQFDFVALNGARSDAVAKARALKDHGVKVYLYSMPDKWTPARWPEGRAQLLTKLAQLRGVASGYIADPENGWADMPEPQRSNLAAAMTRLMAQDAASGNPEHNLAPMSVGVTSFPLFPALEGLGRGSEGKLWACPQFYRDRGADMLGSWMNHWRNIFGEFSVIPGVALWKNRNSPSIHTPAGYSQYLDSIPRAQGAIGWTVARDTPWMTEAYLGWRPGGSLIGQGVYQVGSFVTSPVGMAIAAVALIVAIAFLIWIN